MQASERTNCFCFMDNRRCQKERLLLSGYGLSFRCGISKQVQWNSRETFADDSAYIVLRFVAQGVCGFGKAVLEKAEL